MTIPAEDGRYWAEWAQAARRSPLTSGNGSNLQSRGRYSRQIVRSVLKSGNESVELRLWRRKRGNVGFQLAGVASPHWLYGRFSSSPEETMKHWIASGRTCRLVLGSCLAAVCGCVAPSDNQPPIADAGADQAAFGGDLVMLDGTASVDPDGDELAFLWAPSGGDTVVL